MERATEKTPRPRILVVDDERQITRVLRMALESHGYDVATAEDGRAALKAVEQFAPDLIVTDLSMPNLDGVELTRAVRVAAATPIIVLSVREQDATKVQALDAGADDYMTKPFSTPELLARIRVQLRRQAATREPEPAQVTDGDFTVDVEAHRVIVRGTEVHLTPKEFDLMELFVRNRHRVMTHRALLRAVWGVGEHSPENLRVLVGALRRKIDPPDGPSTIESEPGLAIASAADTLAAGNLDSCPRKPLRSRGPASKSPSSSSSSTPIC